MCHCRNCGVQFKTDRDPSTVYCCSDKCRKEFNNRRMVRGAPLYDLFMTMRYERDAAKAQKLWGKMCAITRRYREQDIDERGGRRSWQPARRVIEQQQVAFAQTMTGSRRDVARCKRTPVQRKILWLMREHGQATFPGNTREFSWRIHEEFGLIIYAYQTPEWFMVQHGLLEGIKTNKPGSWYALTDKGKEAAAKLKEMPR